ncbi:hypothetical protein AK830_g10507 [Neonectria ditissima]|uniref:Uncharacterized protein n=1 Tax=Neonectria ditissima TaxID=78410 RepID=A0A0P7B619_9HYPO|nr:hypothetical protein AK830_g10507 [Neonectria ditissima]
MANLDAVTLDSNVWYAITEARVDDYDKKSFSSSLQIVEDTGDLGVWGAVEQFWQFSPVDGGPDGRYAVRCSKTGVFKQLAVCYNADEIDDSKTQPCMAASDGSKAQMWDVADWGNSTYRFINVHNGSDYVMDTHPGNPPFMASDLRTNIPMPGRHWLMTSRKDVDDGAFSTVFTKIPSATADSVTTTATSSSSESTDDAEGASTASSSSAVSASSSSSSSSHSGLSAGAAAGIGVGVGLAVIGLGLGLLFFWWRRRHTRRTAVATEMPSEEPKPPLQPAPYTDWSHPAPVQEMSSEREVRSELDSTPVWASTVGSGSPETMKTTTAAGSGSPLQNYSNTDGLRH